MCLAFNEKETPLFQKLKKLKSREIKKTIAIFSYNQLIKVSKKEDRHPTELIKMLLAEKLIHKGPFIKRSVRFNPAKVKKWIGYLKKNNKKPDIVIADFLAGIGGVEE